MLGEGKGAKTYLADRNDNSNLCYTFYPFSLNSLSQVSPHYITDEDKGK